MKAILILLAACAFSVCFGADAIVPRKILALYDSRYEKEPTDTFVHKICEMPLNFLGLDVVYHDIKDNLPDLRNRTEVRGILTCFPHEMTLSDPVAYLKWAESAIDLGKKYVFLFDPGFKKNDNKEITPLHVVNRFLAKLGLNAKQDWTQYTFHYQILNEDKEVAAFEHPYPTPLPPFSTMTITEASVRSFLSVGVKGDPETIADLAAAGPHGGYVAQYYASTYTKEEQASEARYWYINPFLFFQSAFDVSQMPIPDTTTLAGRRIFFSQVDGDAWNSLSIIEKYRKKQTTCSEVLYTEIFSQLPSMPVSIGVIAADLDPDWVGSESSQAIARTLLALPQVEAASHSYSHPFDWAFFQDPHQKEKEVDFLHLYPYGSWQSSYLSWLRSSYYLQKGNLSLNEQGLGLGFHTPRAYANHPFDLNQEIAGSTAYINRFLPPGKIVSLFQWTGACNPWETAVALTRQQGLRNLNGGSCRKDADNPSYANVGPLGQRVGDQIQIYAASNDENAYTYEWTGRFYGFKYVVDTFKNTETPLRIKPIDLYYHFYSAENLASLNALRSVLDFVDQQELIPIWPSRYSAIADGFYTTEIISKGTNRWQIDNRGGLQTLRFDQPKLSVDYATSSGVIGHRFHQNSVYVYLDAAHPAPFVVMGLPNVQLPYLVESHWEIWNLQRTSNQLAFHTQGWGALEMQWFLPQEGVYTLKAVDSSGKEYVVSGMKGQDSFTTFHIDFTGFHALNIEITRGGR